MSTKKKMKSKMGVTKRRALNKERRNHELEEIETLERMIVEQTPPKGTNPLANLLSSSSQNKNFEKKKNKKKTKKEEKEEEEKEEEEEIENKMQKTNLTEIKYSETAISNRTKDGLKMGGWERLTHIQAASLPHSLAGRDILGAAKTGSGKTLAFVIPVLENLFRQQWSHMDGLGGIIISPTRELALQTFEVLRKAGVRHSLSAGLVIGGKDVQQEQTRIGSMNVLVCTPGRLLHHLDQTVGFDASQTQVLVLDEADRILDLGFSSTMQSILEHLPQERQTLLFSATQSRSVRQLANLSLKDPEFIAAHEKSSESTPSKLSQHYMVVPLDKKIDMLFSFVRTHLNNKILVFAACCKEVQYLYQIFCKLRPGMPVMALQGKMKQMKRMAVYLHFSKSQSALLFATDIASRGLDITSVDWVLQFDCPDDPETYIHRVGRTARFENTGNALMFVEPSEVAIIGHLEAKKIPIQLIEVNPQKVQSITPRLQSLLAAKRDLQESAKKAFKSYVKCIRLKSNKEVFNVTNLPLPLFSSSLGLEVVPKVKGLDQLSSSSSSELRNRREHSGLLQLQKEIRKEHLQKQGIYETDSEEESDDEDRMAVTLLGDDDDDALQEFDSDQDEEGGLLSKLEGEREELLVDEKELRLLDSKVSNKTLKKMRRGVVVKAKGSRIVFDDDGNSIEGASALPVSVVTDGKNEEGSKKRKWSDDVKENMKKADIEDRQSYQALLKERKLKRKKRRLEEQEEMMEPTVLLGDPDDVDDEEENFDGSDNQFSGEESVDEEDHDDDDDDDDHDDDDDDDDLEEKALKILQRKGLA